MRRSALRTRGCALRALYTPAMIEIFRQVEVANRKCVSAKVGLWFVLEVAGDVKLARLTVHNFRKSPEDP